MVEESSVQITLKDIFIEVRRLQDTVSAMTPQAQQINDHENRLRSVERWRYALPTSFIIAITSVVANAVIATTK